mmetsp:Transcript_5452/g.11984  ORF Transcript_5452/g.11984 Transcript_5452/m.11984 type:complete len:232 (-) Transcript_5452:1739-2434(-)
MKPTRLPSRRIRPALIASNSSANRQSAAARSARSTSAEAQSLAARWSTCPQWLAAKFAERWCSAAVLGSHSVNSGQNGGVHFHRSSSPSHHEQERGGAQLPAEGNESSLRHTKSGAEVPASVVWCFTSAEACAATSATGRRESALLLNACCTRSAACFRASVEVSTHRSTMETAHRWVIEESVSAIAPRAGSGRRCDVKELSGSAQSSSIQSVATSTCTDCRALVCETASW